VHTSILDKESYNAKAEYLVIGLNLLEARSQVPLFLIDQDVVVSLTFSLPLTGKSMDAVEAILDFLEQQIFWPFNVNML
jgi:hypothetical protein